MKKLFKFDQQAKEALLRGVKTLADAVGSTLGPLGNNVAIESKWGYPQVIHDGVTVAKAVSLEDPFENIGAQIVKEASSKTNDMAGDGTTTATVLSYALISEGLKSIENGVNPMKLRRGMNHALKEVLTYIQSQAKTISTLEESTQVATISAQDPEIGKLVAEAVTKVGKDGVVAVSEGSGTTLKIEYKEGMQLDKGFVSPYFATSEDKQRAEVKSPKILVTNHKLTSVGEVLPLLEMLVQDTKDMVFICDSVEGDALATLVGNKARGLNILAVQAPGYGENRRESLMDIASLVGANFIDKDLKRLNSVTREDFGEALRVEATSDTTTIVGGKGDTSKRVSEIRSAMENAKDETSKEFLRVRLSKLTSGAAVISVGASTEVEMREKKERVIDAISATKAAVEEGIVPGGGSVLLRATIKDNKEFDEGIKIVRLALVRPFMKLIENSGLDYLESLQKVKNAKEGEGIDVNDGKIKDLVKAGIIDPVKVVRSALESAVSVAGSILTTSVLIVEKEEKNEKA